MPELDSKSGPARGRQTLLLSDVHLATDTPQLTAGLCQLLASLTTNCDAVYLLGDLFEVWVGDDNHNALIDTLYTSFQQLRERGIALHCCHGNRDFLLGLGPENTPSFAELAGARLMPDAEVVDLYGTPTLLMHGDQLCTLDNAYMAFRALSRSAEWQQQMLEKPLDQRLMIADFWRMQSQAANSNKAENIMDVTPDEVLRVMSEAGVKYLLHGHTHRPMRHPLLLLDGSQGERLVLGDWRLLQNNSAATSERGEAVIAWASAEGIRLETWHF